MSQANDVDWTDVEAVFRHFVDHHDFNECLFGSGASSVSGDDVAKDAIYWMLAHLKPSRRRKLLESL